MVLSSGTLDLLSFYFFTLLYCRTAIFLKNFSLTSKKYFSNF